MATTIEHRAMTRRERETHLQLARETGHAKALAMLNPTKDEPTAFERGLLAAHLAHLSVSAGTVRMAANYCAGVVRERAVGPADIHILMDEADRLERAAATIRSAVEGCAS